jgi:hypothetical protein
VTYYCHDCAIRLGLIKPTEPVDFTESEYQLGKFFKHTLGDGRGGRSSVFFDGSLDAYNRYVVTALASGHAYVDDSGGLGIVWYAGKEVGVTYNGGVFEAPADAVQVVYTRDPERIHAYPVNSEIIQGASCAQCGRPIPI